MTFRFIASITLAVLGSGLVSQAADSLLVLPQEVHLTGPEARQRLLIESADGSIVTGPVVGDVSYVSENARVATVVEGAVVPVGNGSTTIFVTVNGRKTSTKVLVEKFAVEHRWSFRNHVQSVLSKTGCNGGACHGAAAGKSGFKLSLRGYDPDADFFSITRQSRGRRVVSHDPGRSLILTKPLGLIPHKGGVRFTEDSLEFNVISGWIAQGQSPPSNDDSRIERLEILPDVSRLKIGVEQPMVVLAHFNDGRVEEVTRWARYTSTNQAVCVVDDRGLLKVLGNGEGAVVAWYLTLNSTATVTVPHEPPVGPDVFSKLTRANFIDDLVLEKLASLNVPPSPKSDDSEFLRRSFLDTIGLLPTVEQAQSFLAETDPEKRNRLIEQLISRPEFVDYWSYQWSDLLLLTEKRLKPLALKSYYQWIRERVAENSPWDEFVRGILLAVGSTFENGAANFYALHQDPQDMVETSSMAFLGMSLQCARCHDHPNEKWSNDDYYGMVSLFSHVRNKDFSNTDDGNRTIFLADRGEVLQPRTARPQPPKPLDGDALSCDDPADRRIHLANWLTSAQNPYFTRSIVNRVWANFFGRGLVEAVDDLRLTNPASNEKLFARLARDFVSHKYDLKNLMRTILQSETYQRSPATLTANAFDHRFYSHSYPRRLKAEVMLDAFSQVTDVPTTFKGQPIGMRATQLPDANIASYFLDTFGRPERVLTCACERSNDPSMTQAFHLTNGPTIQEKLESQEGRIPRFIESNTSPEEIIRTTYLAAFSRLPTDNETLQLLAVFAETSPLEKRQVVEDLFWSIFTSREFLFQH